MQYLYYDDSILLKRLSYYPYIQLGVMLLFIVIAYFALISTKKAEQNKVWVGLSKETAASVGYSHIFFDGLDGFAGVEWSGQRVIDRYE